jgi:hypothetical protein
MAFESKAAPAQADIPSSKRVIYNLAAPLITNSKKIESKENLPSPSAKL